VFLLAALAITSGGLAASQVQSSIERVESQVGGAVPVVVAREAVGAGTRLGPQAAERALEVQERPARFVPSDSLSSIDDVIGLRTAASVAAGGYLTIGHLETQSIRREAGPALAPGERVVELVVAGGQTVGAAGPGSRVDVLITTEGAAAGAGHTYVALENVELLDVRSAGGELESGSDGGAGGALASLRVTLEQAVLLTAAQNFAREVRLLARSPEDRKPVGRNSVSGADL